MSDLKPCPRPDCKATADHYHHRTTGDAVRCIFHFHDDTRPLRIPNSRYTECYAPRIPEPKPLPDIKDVKPGDWVELSSGDAKIVGTVYEDGGFLTVGDRKGATVICHLDNTIRHGWTLTDYHRAAEPLIPDWPIGCLVEVVKPEYGYVAGARLRLIPSHAYDHLPNSAEGIGGRVWAAPEGRDVGLCWPADQLRLIPEPDRPDWWQTRGAVVEDEVCWLWTCLGSSWRRVSRAMSYDELAAERGPLTLVSLPVDGAK